MYQQTVELPATVGSPNSSIRRLADFGEFQESGFDVIWGEISAGVNVTSQLEETETDYCQCSYWGFILDGTIHARFLDGTEEIPTAGDAVYWPPGHAIYTEDDDVEFVLFSPTEEHGDIRDQIRQKESELAATLPIWE